MSVGIARLLTETVSVKTRLGTKNGQASYATAVDVLVFPNDGVREIRDADGVETVSQTTYYAALSDVDKFTPGSEVIGHGRTAHVISTTRREVGPPTAHHVQVSLT